MNLQRLISLVMLGLVSLSGLANGDPVSCESMLLKTSNPATRQAFNINVEREDRDVKLGHMTEVRMKGTTMQMYSKYHYIYRRKFQK